MSRGRTKRGRERASSRVREPRPGRPLFRTVDHGEPIRLDGELFGATEERWIEPFLQANRPPLRRVGGGAEVRTDKGLHVCLVPGDRVGAIPLLSHSTRCVVAGLLIAPRFRWSALGAVLGETAFAIEPAIGGTPLVPGSARQVPVWLLAAPVIRRLEELLRHSKRGFVERAEVRFSPRGRVDWSNWARRFVPSGRWGNLPCHFTEPDSDPVLMAAVRWTLDRLDEELGLFDEAFAARLLRARVAEMRARVGEGETRRPAPEPMRGAEWLVEATQAMGWVAEERGLGGARALDGLGWDLPVGDLWEAWVDAFVSALAPRCGMTALRRGSTSRRLNWMTPTSSMRLLVPDAGLRGEGRLVWIDAKYKAHLHLVAQKGWSGLDESMREAHRADLHQALAYASLGDVEHVDSVLVYPDIGGTSTGPAIATVAAGRRRVRLILAGLPFGFRSPRHREETLASWRDLLAA